MATIVDSYSESNRNSEEGIGKDWCLKASQSFTGDGGTLNSVKFFLRKDNSPTGNIVVKIYNHSGTFGSSSQPAEPPIATSDAINSATLTSSFSLITFTFSGSEKIVLENGIHYCVSLEYVGESVYPDLIMLGDDGTGEHQGNLGLSFNGSSWYTYSSNDCCFYVYRDDELPSLTTIKDIIGNGFIPFAR